MSEYRISRLEEQVREEISKMILSGHIKDKRVTPFLCINKVVISADLSYAKVYVSSFMDEHVTKQGVRGLENASGFIRTTLSRLLHIRKTPSFTFIYDKSIKEGQEMISLINSLDITEEQEDSPLTD